MEIRKIQLSVYNTWSQQKIIKHVYPENEIEKIHKAQTRLTEKIKAFANEIVLTEIV